MSNLTQQFALFINGEIYCEPNPYEFIPWMASSPKPAIFDDRNNDALAAAARIREQLVTHYHIDPVITVAHRYCSTWDITDLSASIVAKFEELLSGEDGRDA